MTVPDKADPQVQRKITTLPINARSGIIIAAPRFRMIK